MATTTATILMMMIFFFFLKRMDDDRYDFNLCFFFFINFSLFRTNDINTVASNASYCMIHLNDYTMRVMHFEKVALIIELVTLCNCLRDKRKLQRGNRILLRAD